MAEPILEPGRAGDLKMILDHAVAELEMLRAEDEASKGSAVGINDRAYGIAVATHEALSMWLGLKPVAETPSNA